MSHDPYLRRQNRAIRPRNGWSDSLQRRYHRLGQGSRTVSIWPVDLREMGIRSIPVNLLSPIPGTPFEENEVVGDAEMIRIIAIFRMLVPDAYIRLAGGRGLLADKGRQCFLSGANAAISGDMLTTDGITIEQDMRMLGELGYEVVLRDD